MIGKITSLGMLALVLTASLLVGCQTAATPNALTGKSSDAIRYTDDKGHLHADLAAAQRSLR